MQLKSNTALLLILSLFWGLSLSDSLADERPVEVVLPESIRATLLSMNLTADGQWMFSCSAQSYGVLRNAYTGTALRLFDSNKGHGAKLVPGFHLHSTSGAISANGSRVAMAVGKTVSVWETRSGRLIHALSTHSSEVTALALGDDGSRIVTANGSTVNLWDGESGRRLQTLPGHKGVIVRVSITSDKSRVISGSVEGELFVWDAEKGARIHTIATKQTELTALAFNGDSSLAVTGDNGATCQLWNTTTGELVRQFTVADDQWAKSTAISGDGRVIACGYEKSVVVWDVSGKNLLRLESPKGTTSLALDQNGRRLFVGYPLHEAVAYDTATGKKLLGFGGSEGQVFLDLLNESGTRASTRTAKEVRLWNPSTNETIASVESTGDVSELFLSANGNRFFVGVNQEDRRQAELIDVEPQRRSLPFHDYQNPLSTVCMSDNGRYVAAWDRIASAIVVRDCQTGKDVATLDTPESGYLSMDAEGSRVAQGASVWDVSSQSLISTMAKKPRVLSQFGSISKDGKYLLNRSFDVSALFSSSSVSIWDIETGRALKTLRAPKDPGRSFFTADGQRVLLAGTGIDGDNAVMISDAKTGKQIRKLIGHVDAVDSITELAGGKLIAAAATNRTLVWDAATGIEICRFSRVGDTLEWLCMTPTGEFDGSPEAIKQVRFRIAETIDYVPDEEALRRWHHPGLFQQLVSGNHPVPTTNPANQ